MVELVFEDIFTLTRLDPDSKKFDKGKSMLLLKSVNRTV
ncbi:unnamed protein product [Musa acuminata subsp. malaccensis]|uniref:(wild Malaysian banana) hypothetical protein n=1 Tax=Musa acuminata subsp. malaccensis TaxID=214687 RepID=A0A804IL12_MUSAM|nr:unnamed protein product [Musa acuminata subsp. malaccensis]